MIATTSNAPPNSIPKFAELAALSNKVVANGDYTLMNGLSDDTGINQLDDTTGTGVLKVSGVNDPLDNAVPAEPAIGAGMYPLFSTAVNYAIGDKVTYSYVPYVFIATHTAGAWNAAHVTKAPAILEDNPLDNGGNDDSSNIR